MLKIDRFVEGDAVLLALSGRIEREGLSGLQRALDAEAASAPDITIDIKELWLLDRDAVRFLVRCAARGIRLVNTPAFIREWMRREQHSVGDERP